MNYCTNCGNKVQPHNQYCGECGHKLLNVHSKNQIDDKYKMLERNFTSSQQQFQESETMNKIKFNVDRISYRILQFFGVVSLIVIAILVFNPLITGKEFIVKSAFETNINVTDFRKSYGGFFGEISVFVIPLCIVLVGFWDKELIRILTITTLIFLFLYILSLFEQTL